MSTKDTLEQPRSTLSPAKQALLEKRLRGNSVAVTLPKRPDSEFAPTTFVQQRLWFLDQLEPGTATYTIPLAMRVRGPLHISTLEQCLNELVRRHETWRTTFESRGGIPIQHIGQPGPITFSVRDLSTLPESQREHEAIQLATEEARTPFHLAEGPLVRVLLLKLDEADHLFVLAQHHIISDGWSIGIILQEIVVLYEAFLVQKPSPLPELALQYGDYAYWQQQHLQGPELERQLAYWKQQLEDVPPHLELPTRRARSDLQTFHGDTQHFQLSRALSEQLRALCEQENVTLFMTMLAAFQMVLHCYTGQDDLLIGTSIANRMLPELEPMVGFFVNTLILRTDLSGDPPFQELLKRVRDVSLAAFAHQEAPFERAVSRVPLLQVHFILQNTPSEAKELAGLNIERIELETQTAKFDLFLNVEDATEIFGFFEYNVDLFDAATIQRLSVHFQRLLEAIVQDPTRRLSAFPLLTTEEKQHILAMWNSTSCVEQQHGCIQALFEAQVARSPLQAAVEFAGVVLTYEELNQRANQIAYYLRQLGVAPEVPVGLYLERSLDLMVGVLGILKAGGAYLPMDPAYPKERCEWMLADAQVPILLTQTAFLPLLPAYDGRVVCLDDCQEFCATMPTTNPVYLATEENAAYIIYTSGSTGQPKGVLVTHRSLINHSQAIARQYSLCESDRVLQFASLSFDAAGEELYPTWLSGATLVLRPEDLPASIEMFHQFIRQERLTVLDLPTAYWHQWVTRLSPTDVPLPASLRLVIVGGEAVQPAYYDRWLQFVGPQIQWSNTYGPTEATITAILYTPTEIEDPQRHQMPIGCPIANLQAYVLDQQLQPVPLGAPGELYLGGEGLARCYLNRPALTAERFIPNPYGPAGSRLYRTGDLVRSLIDGNLLYVGRSDQQVKIRGYRIELGEIESSLLQYPEILESVVLARDDSAGDKYLVAYIISNQPDVSAAELRQFLGEHLPAYMLPASYIFLEQFPLTTSGKINRHALPAPARDRQESTAAYEPPRAPFEEILVGIWCDVLHIEQVGIRDNFFEIGGHSLRAIQLLARIQDVFPLELPLRHLFVYPTIASLAEFLCQDDGQREIITTTAELFMTVNNLSDEEVEALLNE
jgi:amino acid adenylation domain-containing protein